MGIVVASATSGDAPKPSTLEPMPLVTVVFNCNTLKYIQGEV